MKVYELMKALGEMPAGAEVVFSRAALLSEMPIIDGHVRRLDFTIRSATLEENRVELDGWAE